MSRLGRALPVASLTAILTSVAGCGTSNHPLYSKIRLTSSDLAAAVTTTGAGEGRPFHVTVTGQAGSLNWTYHGNGAVDIAKGTGSENQVNAAGKPYSASSNPTPSQMPVVSMVFTRPDIYWKPWGVTAQALTSSKLAQGATWISLSAADTANASSGGQKVLVLATSLADPFLYLAMLDSGVGNATFAGNATVAGSSARRYIVTVDGAQASAAVPGLDSGLVQLLGSASGTSKITFSVWIGPSGSLDRIEFTTSGGPQSPGGSPASGGSQGSSGSPASGGSTGTLPKVEATISFAGPGVPSSATVASPPPTKAALALSSLMGAATSSGTGANEAPASPESCAEDQADHGTDAGKCSGATTTTASPGG